MIDEAIIKIDEAIIKNVRRTLGDAAAADFVRDGYVFGWRLAPLDVGPLRQYRYVCADCYQWWGHGAGSEIFFDAGPLESGMRADFEREVTRMFAQRCPHLAGRMEGLTT